MVLLLPASALRVIGCPRIEAVRSPLLSDSNISDSGDFNALRAGDEGFFWAMLIVLLLLRRFFYGDDVSVDCGSTCLLVSYRPLANIEERSVLGAPGRIPRSCTVIGSVRTPHKPLPELLCLSHGLACFAQSRLSARRASGL